MKLIARITIFIYVILGNSFALQVIDLRNVVSFKITNTKYNDDIAQTLKKIQYQIDKALREDGMFIAINHGIPQKLINESLAASYELFDEKLDKSNLKINNSTSFGRGFIEFGHESGLSNYFEPKEGYSYGNPNHYITPSYPIKNLLTIPNKWPESFSNKSIHQLNTLYHENVKLAKFISSSLSNMFVCDSNRSSENLFNVSRGGEDISILRMFHYYNIYSKKLMKKETEYDHITTKKKQSIGSSPHTDWGFLTIILADNIKGLQFLSKKNLQTLSTTASSVGHTTNKSIIPDSLWEKVPMIPGSIVINGGDYLSLISKGVYYSPVHRVISPDDGYSNEYHDNNNNDSHIEDDNNYNIYNGNNNNNGNNSDDNNTYSTVETVVKDRYSFVFFFYPGYDYPVSDQVLSHCYHHLITSSCPFTTADINSSTSNDNELHQCNSEYPSRSSSTVTTTGLSSSSSNQEDDETITSAIPSNPNPNQYNTIISAIPSTSNQYNTLTSAIPSTSNQYNTLISTEEELPSQNTAASTPSRPDAYHMKTLFGDYIIKKWMDVYRQ